MNTKLLLIFLLLNSSIFSQKSEDSLLINIENSEFSQKPKCRNLISVDGLGWYSYLVNDFSTFDGGPFVYKDGSFKETRSIFNFGGRISFLHLLNKRLGLGIEYGIEQSKMQMSRRYWVQEHSENPYLDTGFTRIYEAFTLQTHSINLKMEWRKNGDNFPFQLSHQAGVGVQFSNILQKDYHYVDIESDSNIPTYDLKINPKPIFETTYFIGVSAFYALNYRFKLSDHFGVNLGIRQAFNYIIGGFAPREELTDYSKYFHYKTETLNAVSKNRVVSGTSFNLGLVFLF